LCLLVKPTTSTSIKYEEEVPYLYCYHIRQWRMHPENLIPQYAKIQFLNMSPATKFTIKKIRRIWIKCFSLRMALKHLGIYCKQVFYQQSKNITSLSYLSNAFRISIYPVHICFIIMGLLSHNLCRYCPPQLAIANLYWKGWIMLLILSAHNPTTFGSVAWEKYPTLHTLMEMCITK
jgi:hypothetical protein